MEYKKADEAIKFKTDKRAKLHNKISPCNYISEFCHKKILDGKSPGRVANFLGISQKTVVKMMGIAGYDMYHGAVTKDVKSWKTEDEIKLIENNPPYYAKATIENRSIWVGLDKKAVLDACYNRLK